MKNSPVAKWEELKNKNIHCLLLIKYSFADSDCSKRWGYIRDYYVRRQVKPGTRSSGEAVLSMLLKIKHIKIRMKEYNPIIS